MTTPLTRAARALALAQSGVDCFDDLEPEAQELAIEHAAAVLRAGADWQPIETAPKDQSGTGKMVLLLERGHAGDYDSRVVVGFWGDYRAGLAPDGVEHHAWLNWHEGLKEDGNWHVVHEPTHWMPLPAPPSEAG